MWIQTSGVEIIAAFRDLRESSILEIPDRIEINIGIVLKEHLDHPSILDTCAPVAENHELSRQDRSVLLLAEPDHAIIHLDHSSRPLHHTGHLQSIRLRDGAAIYTSPKRERVNRFFPNLRTRLRFVLVLQMHSHM